MDLIYLDHGATTPLLPEVWETMRPYFLERSGNPASSHHAGRGARRALEDARERVAHLLDAQADEVIFTSGATEANNLAIFGLAGQAPGRIVASPVEHPCVTEPVRRLAATGFDVAWLPVTGAGCVPDDALTQVDAARLVTVMLVNHETGAVQPVADLAASVAGRAAFHCDAAAAVGKVPVSFRRLGVTTLALSAHKFHGPKGIGALLLQRDARLQPQLFGGHQQRGQRPGTEPVPLAVGMATALELACSQLAERHERVLKLRTMFLDSVRQAMPIVINGSESGGVPHTLNLSFPGCRADVLLMKLDLAGVACATGSACSSGSLLPSPVLQAMGVAEAALRSALRFTFSFVLAEAEVMDAARRVVDAVARLRNQRVGQVADLP